MVLRMGHELPRAETHGAPVVIGVDIGQRHDPSAVAVAEYLKRNREDMPEVQEWYFPIRHLERVPLNTSYPDVAARVVEIVDRLQARALPPKKITVAVDVTGVGRGVSDILAAPLRKRSVRLTNVTIVAGLKLTGAIGRRDVSIGKEQMVSRLQALFQTGRVEIPSSNKEAEAMARELLDFEIRLNDKGNMQSGAFKVGSHDDLVIALALSVLHDPKSRGVWVPSMVGV